MEMILSVLLFFGAGTAGLWFYKTLRSIVIQSRSKKWLLEPDFEQCRDNIFNQYRLTIRNRGKEEQLYHNSTHREPIPVLTPDGSVYHVPWLGFVLREEATDTTGTWVALDVSRLVKGVCPEHVRELAPGEYVQGWLVQNGVFAVTDSLVAVADFGPSNSRPMRFCRADV